MATKAFGVKEIKLDGTGTPTIASPSGGNLNITAGTATFSSNLTVSNILTVNGQTVIDEVNINDNVVQTNTSNELVVRGKGTGGSHHLKLDDDVTIVGDAEFDAGIKDKDGDLGTSGQILSSTGTQVNWIDASSIGGGGSSNVSISNQTDDRVVTCTGTTDALNGEEHLTFSGSVLGVPNVVIGTGDDWSVANRPGGSGCTADLRNYICISRLGANIYAPQLSFRKNRSTTWNDDDVAVQSGDVLGQIHFDGNDGGGYHTVGKIICTVSGEVATSSDTTDIPTKMYIGTSHDGEVSGTGITIGPSGDVGIQAEPVAWGKVVTNNAEFRSLQIGKGAAFAGAMPPSTPSEANGGLHASWASMSANIKITGSGTNHQRAYDDFASQYYQHNGDHVFRTAPSGTADAYFGGTLAEKFRITQAGNVNIGGNYDTQSSALLYVYRQSSEPAINITGDNGNDAIFEMFADRGDNNADKWRIVSEADYNDLKIESYSSGSWVPSLTLGSTTSTLVSNTSDGSDDGITLIGGGGAANVTRGSLVAAYGNEHSAAKGGQLELIAGSIPLAQSYTISVQVIGSSSYTLSGTDSTGSISGADITVRCNAGDTLNFSLSTTGHPFYIKTTFTDFGSGSQVTEGTISGAGQGATSGTLTWDTTGVTPGTYWYQSGNSTAFTGSIVVSAELAGGNITFSTSATEQMRITKEGDVKIKGRVIPSSHFVSKWHIPL